MITAFSQTNYQDDAMTQYYTGRDAYNSGNYKDAQYYFQRALIIDPQIEARAQNIKFWLGISAFNNGDFKTAKVNLQLFPDTRIAQDLLVKIEEMEANADDYYFLNNDIYEEPSHVEEIVVNATETAEESSGGINPIIILAVIWLVVIAVAVILEMRLGVFSRLAIRLVKKGNLKVSEGNVEVKIPFEKNDVKPEVSQETEEIPPVLFDTPFEEEIDIDEMASRDIEEISRYFNETMEEQPEENGSVIQDLRTRMKEKDEKDKKNLSAREEILRSSTEEYPEETDAVNTMDMSAADLEENLDLGEVAEEDNVSSLSKDISGSDLETLDFDEDNFIQKAAKIIEQAKELSDSQYIEERTEWKSINELTKEMEESDIVKDLEYYENMKDMGEGEREEFYNFVFNKGDSE